ncbi:MAG: hypothetical protein IE922_15390, partial [Sphingomonadales bacterium]|nr:hypothetical protein [Sphingomonadales bacterium]
MTVTHPDAAVPHDPIAPRPAMRFATAGPSLPLYPVAEGAALPEGLDAAARNWAAAQGFRGAQGQVCLLPGAA